MAKLRQADEALARGAAIAEVARSLGVSEVTLHRWRAEYGAVGGDAGRRSLDEAAAAQRRPAGATETQETQADRQRQERHRAPQGAQGRSACPRCGPQAQDTDR